MQPSSSRDERMLALIDKAYKEWDENGMINLDTLAELDAAGIDADRIMDEDDGQPSELTEWHDFDPDC